MKQSSNKQRRGERICRILDISPETLINGHAVEILGRSLVKIRGGGAILLYTENEIRVALQYKREYVSILGESLSCSSYNRGTLGIEGKIDSVCFGRTERGERR
jgi:hypothetical protein